MRTIKTHSRLVALIAAALGGAAVATMLVTYLSTARATGIPTTDPLYYSGLLADTSGNPLAGTMSISIDLWSSKTATTSLYKKCSTAATSATLVQGRFRVALDKTCVDVLQDNPDLWVEVTVTDSASKTTTFPRQKIGAAPYSASLPDTLKVTGDATFTVHSNTDTPTSGSKMLVLKTGKTTPTEVFSVDNAGRVGIGTASPAPGSSWEVEVVGDVNIRKGSGQPANDDGHLQIGSHGHLLFDITKKIVQLGSDFPGADLRFVTRVVGGPYVEAVTVSPAGYVGIGTTSPGSELDVNGHAIIGDGTGRIYIQDDAVGGTLWVGGGKPLTIQGPLAGNVGIGVSSPSEKLHVSGNILATGSITPGSSRALKDRVRDLSSDDAQAAVSALRPTRFYYKADKADEHLGFIAEDVPALLATKDRKGVDPMDVAAVLTKVVQQQQLRLDAQTKALTAHTRAMTEQRREIEELKKQVKQLRRRGG